MKALLVAAMLLVPSLALAESSPLGFAIRVGPVWRDHLTASCSKKHGLEEQSENKAEIAATFAPSYQINEYFSLVGSATRFFDSEQDEYAVQLEYRWPGCEVEKAPAPAPPKRVAKKKPCP